MAIINDYPNPKITELIAHVSGFTPRDFLDAALAMLDQASLRTAAYSRAYRAVEDLIAKETPEDDGDSEAAHRTGFDGA